MAKKKLRKAHDALMKADETALDASAPREKSKPVTLLAWLSEIGDQPQLLALSGGLLALGLARRDRRRAGAGARMQVHCRKSVFGPKWNEQEFIPVRYCAL